MCSSDLDAIRFVWAGSITRGEAHYYRLHGPAFVIEYDNSQNNANHIHSVFRDFNGDFGVDVLAAHGLDEGLSGIGHRVVHGGRRFCTPVRVDPEVERAIDELSRLAPQHNPPALEGIRLAQELFPDAPAVAVFDTAFHANRAAESEPEPPCWRCEAGASPRTESSRGRARTDRIPGRSPPPLTVSTPNVCADRLGDA